MSETLVLATGSGLIPYQKLCPWVDRPSFSRLDWIAMWHLPASERRLAIARGALPAQEELRAAE